MITAKAVLYGAALVIVSVALAALAGLFLIDDDVLVDWFAGQVEARADVSLDYAQPAQLSRSLKPTLTLRDLALRDAGSGFTLSTSSMELQLSLPQLLVGRLDILRLWLGDTRLVLPGGATVLQGRREGGPPSVLPAVHDLRISRLRVESGQREMHLPPLAVNTLTMTLDAAADVLNLSAGVQVALRQVEVEAAVSDFRRGLADRRLAFDASAAGPSARMQAQGRLDFSQAEPRLDARLSALASELGWLAPVTAGLNLPGTLSAQGRVAGPLDRLKLDALHLAWEGPGRSRLDAEGGIDDLDDLGGVALKVSGRLGESPWLTPALPDGVSALQTAEWRATLKGGADRFAISDLELNAADSEKLRVALGGRFDLARTEGALQAENLDLQLAFAAPSTRAARVLLFEDVPELGAVEGRAEIRSEAGDPSLENLVVSTRDPAGIEADLSGRIGAFPLDPERPNRDYAVDFSVSAEKATLLAQRLELDLPIDGPLSAGFLIQGGTRELRLEKIKLAAGGGNGPRLGAEGRLQFGDWAQADPLHSVDLRLAVDSADTATLSRLLHTDLPELGALDASAHLHTVSGRHRLSDVQLRSAQGAPLRVAVQGSAAQLSLLPEPGVRGLALTVTAEMDDLSRINRMMGWKDAVPALGPGEAKVRIAGSDRSLSVSDLSFKAGRPGLVLLKAQGGLGVLAAADHWRPRGTDVKLEGYAQSTRSLAEALGYRLPELGALAASAQLVSEGDSLVLQAGRLRVGDAWKPAMQATGFIDDLLGAAKTRWDVALDLGANQFARLADEKQIPDLGSLQGQARISNADGSLGIDTLKLSSTGSDLLRIVLDGSYGDFRKPASARLNGVVSARDLEVVGALLDRDWPAIGPFRLETRLNRVVNNLRLDTHITAGKAVTHADLVATLEAEPPLISGRIEASEAFLPSLAKAAETSRKKMKGTPGPVFSRAALPLGWMHKFDLDVSLDVQSFDPERVRAESARADIAMHAGQLWVRPATVRFPRGRLDFQIQVDARRTPKVSFAAHGRDLYPAQMLDMEQVAKDKFPDLDIDIDLGLSGHSPHQLASSAQGSIAMELKDGFLRRDLIDLVFGDIIGWAWTRTAHEKYYQFECAVADFSVNQGLVTTNAFLLDADHIAITGDGSVDMGRETIDYAFLPKKKSRFIGKADPVRVSGSLGDPSVKVIPWKSAATTYAPLLFGPFIFAGVTAAEYLGSKVFDSDRQSPCLEYEQQRAKRAGDAPTR